MHIEVPRRHNPHLGEQPHTDPVVARPGKKKRRRDSNSQPSDNLNVCRHCRLLQRDRDDVKKAKRLRAAPVTTEEQERSNMARMRQYQAGSMITEAQVRPTKGTADHWCGLEPASEQHRLLGPYFIKILTHRYSRTHTTIHYLPHTPKYTPTYPHPHRLTNRPARNKGIVAFTNLSEDLANLPLLAKRYTNTRYTYSAQTHIHTRRHSHMRAHTRLRELYDK